MYLLHFHLVEKPFEYLIPNPRYLAQNQHSCHQPQTRQACEASR
jgi:hypothetical protein